MAPPPYEAAVLIASHLDDEKLALLASTCREYRSLLYSPAVWKCRSRLLYLENFIHLGDRGALTQARTLQINCYRPHTDDLHRRESTFANRAEFLRLIVGTSFDEMEFVLQAVRTESLKSMCLTAFLVRNDQRFGQIFSGLKFPNLMHLNCSTTAFFCHALVFAAACPNLQTMRIYESESNSVSADPAAVFENLTDLLYDGCGTGVARHFVASTKLQNLDIRSCETEISHWTRLRCRRLTELLLPYQAESDVLEALLTKWHETLKTMWLPASFAGGILPFVERLRPPRLERIIFYPGVDEQTSQQLREPLFEACPSLQILHFNDEKDE